MRRDRRSTGSRLQAPEQPPARAVPADHRLWAHHHPGVAPIEESAEQRECDAADRIDSPRPGRLAAAPRDNQSLPDRSIYSLLSSAIARRYSDIRYARRSTAPGEFNYCGGQVPQLCTMARLGVVSPPFGVPAHRHRFRARAFMPHHTHSWRLLCISAAAYCESPRSPGLAAVAGHLCWTYS